MVIFFNTKSGLAEIGNTRPNKENSVEQANLVVSPS